MSKSLSTGQPALLRTASKKILTGVRLAGVAGPAQKRVDTQLLMQVVLNLANLSSPAKPFTQAKEWALRQQAERWAKRLVSSEQPVEEIWWAAFTRAPRPDERQSTQAYLDARIAEGMAREQALAELCHVVFNLKEFVFLP